MSYAYYPGCSLQTNSTGYDVSIRRIAAELDLELNEVDDWNCCGGTEYQSVDRLAAYAVVARNLARVAPDLHELVAPCSACYLNLAKVDQLMRDDPAFGNRIQESLAAGGLGYNPGRVRVRHVLDILHEDVGPERIQARVRRPLRGLRVAPYYGCQVVRPIEGFDDPEYPRKLDELLGWLGAEVVDYPVKSHCCGGHMTQISEPKALELIRRLLDSAAEYDADLIACLCPMCQLNLDAYHGRTNDAFKKNYHLPTVFFTQLIGVAFGIEPSLLGFGGQLVPAEPVLEAKLSRSSSAGEEPLS